MCEFKDNYKVVIYCTTYNQKAYIEDALKGFINQKTNFKYCAVIIDDCSTDGQQEIIKAYAEKFPEIIKPIFLTFNHYQKRINKEKYFEPWIAKSEYIAHCEGDDYWIDDHKLQIQVNFMENHPECSLTYHPCINQFEDNYTGIPDKFGENVKDEYNCEEILSSYYFQTATILYRSNLRNIAFVKKSLSILHYSSVLFFCASQYGRVLGINKEMSVYRRCNSGVSNISDKSELQEYLYNGWLKISIMCDDIIKNKIHKIVLKKYLYSIYKINKNVFIKLLWNELKYYPSIVFIIIVKIIRYQMVYILKKYYSFF